VASSQHGPDAGQKLGVGEWLCPSTLTMITGTSDRVLMSLEHVEAAGVRKHEVQDHKVRKLGLDELQAVPPFGVEWMVHSGHRMAMHSFRGALAKYAVRGSIEGCKGTCSEHTGHGWRPAWEKGPVGFRSETLCGPMSMNGKRQHGRP
jgi:hypothetical protein